ncbi:unnamed protein product [Durusdinium trenchii]|uniref:Uncharacterized protein n=1 Tax=Durusdinium trenchii TaxID=1381693 RepID=A0ABP0K135_9DINO
MFTHTHTIVCTHERAVCLHVHRQKDVQNVGAEAAGSETIFCMVSFCATEERVGQCGARKQSTERNPQTQWDFGAARSSQQMLCGNWSNHTAECKAWEQYETDVKPEEPGHEAPAETGSGVSVPSLFGIPSFDKKQDTNGKGQDESDEEEQRPEPEPPQKAEGECKTQ